MRRRHKEPSPEVIAHHEAGHAVVAVYLGLPLDHVSIEPSDWYLGLVKIDVQSLVLRNDRELRACLDAGIVGALGGLAAEGVFFGDEAAIGDGAIGDVTSALILIASLLPQRRKRQLAQGSEDEAIGDIEDRLPRYLARARRLIQKHQHEVAAVARALLKRRTLAAIEVESLCSGPRNAPRWEAVRGSEAPSCSK